MTPSLYKAEEDLIAEILGAWQHEKKPNFSELSRKYGVSRKKLSRRWNGLPSRSTRPPTNRVLSLDQEKAIFLWLEYLDNIGASPTSEQIEASANYLLAKDFTGSGEPPRVGKMWTYDFQNRLPEKYVRIIQKPQEKERTASEHYGEVERCSPSKSMDFDETGFIVGRGKDEAVVTAYPKTSKRVSSLSSRESITVVECINAEGLVIPPLLIPKGKVHMEEWYQHIKDDDWLIAPAENGFITDEIAFEWLQHFHHFTKPEKWGDWRLLLMDNHTTHLTMQFVEYCEIFHIRPFRFPAHSTHFLQPLDGVPFQQYKHVHGRVVNKVARLAGFDFDKNDFFEELHDIRLKTFTNRTIRNGWRERGIWPINPSLILDKMPSPEEAFEAMVAEGDTLKIYGEADEAIPSSPTTKSISPPSTVAKLRRYVNKIEKSIDSIKDILDEASPGLSRRIKVVNQRSLTLAELGDLHRESFAKVRDTAARKNKKTTRRQVKASGALYVGDANRLIKRRHDGDLLRIHKSHALGMEEPAEAEAPTEPQNFVNILALEPRWPLSPGRLPTARWGEATRRVVVIRIMSDNPDLQQGIESVGHPQTYKTSPGAPETRLETSWPYSLEQRYPWVAGLKTKRAGGAMEEDPAVTTRVGRVVVPSTRAREALEGADSTDATTATRRTTSKVKPTAVRKAANQIEERQCAQDENQMMLRKMCQYLEGTYREVKSLKETLSKQEKNIQE
ncbi:conserved hypothetical protein [Talaromyces stipitatus ATCC 10500]|uniref:HTH CENPB-type domain-containing protein n=1 Tax=Talaromyces stipitatus (strain ATCC 10500 / CBS 375.48 / QM 6759 / NRRL 1006) TaxID=441959 RepID=B8MIB5_TALSN|nr:uncharacterized protein TSTA_040780 [Talaromyces stipitatus ATCC 10500]EED14599.1 conserved hypothetical protein [Talaromyces stipitatus ATCC 10500]